MEQMTKESKSAKNSLWIVCEDFSSLYDSGIVEGSPLHYHLTCELFLCAEGECEYFIDNKTYILKAGDMVLTRPNVLHKTNYNPETQNSRYVIYCASFLFPQSVQEILSESDYYITSLPEEVGNAEFLFSQIHNEAVLRDKFSEDMIKSYLAAISVLFFRYSKSNDNVARKVKSGIVEAAIEYIKDNFSRDITLESAAKHISTSSKYLSQVFKKEVEINFNEYLAVYRLRQSVTMITTHPEKSITEIAYDCGFNNSSHFSARFKKECGCTPTQFRNGELPEKPRNIYFFK